MIEQLSEIAVDELMPDPSQPRKTFLDDEISRLAASVAARGILQPLRVIRDAPRHCWLILTGESRWRAARLAGLKCVPCLIVEGELSEVEKLADRLTENSVRHDLQPMEEAAGMAKLKALMGCNSKTLVEEYGFTGASITRMEALLRLPPGIQAMVGTGPGQVPPSAAYEISRLDDEQAQLELARAVADRRISRDGVAEKVRNRVGRKNVRPKSSRLACRLDGGVSITVISDGQPLTWDGFNAAIDRIRKEAKRLYESGKEITELARLLRAS
jgi:ParB family transcriptional regulator, chromosome partitioning protein